jgi:hypothetical protein
VVFAALIAPGLWFRERRRSLLPIAGALVDVLAGLTASWLLDAPSGGLVALLLALYGVASGAFGRRSSVA